ncbi:MAG: stage II sporulation protein R [Clostridia bacterium]|nr:stage II sporulation protein R [Clostridia bacterium]
MEGIKKTIIPILAVMLSALLLAIMPTEAEAMIYEDTVRLHIRAASDSAEDQAVKLSVRDMLLEKYGSIMNNVSDMPHAEECIRKNLGYIERDIELLLCELGYSYGASCDICTEWFDARTYESFTLPEGYYKALIIRLGEGEGRNWWCVMYPPLCLDIATGQGALSDSERALISHSGYRVKFKILEGVSRLFK